MIRQKIILLFLILILTVQILPFEWVGVIFDKNKGKSNIAKLISLSSTDEEDTNEQFHAPEQLKFLQTQFHNNYEFFPNSDNRHYPIFLNNYISAFFREILIPPPNLLA